MKLVIYRDRNTLEIKNFHEYREKYCTEAAITAWNKNTKKGTYVEVVELEENSIAYYFYTLIKRTTQDRTDRLRRIADDFREFTSQIENFIFSLEQEVKNKE